MELLTHVIIGAAVAQFPQSQRKLELTRSNWLERLTRKTSPNLGREKVDWKARALIGALAALFPDIDYLLFWVSPLDFLAYWHRAETHSILLAPFWSLLLSIIFCRLWTVREFKLLYFICLVSLLSHALIDSLTIYGTGWFLPLSDFKVSWDLLFVIDPYFTIFALAFAYISVRSRKTAIRLIALLIPASYLIFVATTKSYVYKKLEIERSHANTDFRLLPQPFSPFYWQGLIKEQQKIKQIYVKVFDDPVAKAITDIFGEEGYSEKSDWLNHASWKEYKNYRAVTEQKDRATHYWQRQEFRAFRDFAQYPVLLDHDVSLNEECFWFSDLRYHWPNITPSFRYAICQNNEGRFFTRRLKYFSTQSNVL